MYNFADSFEAVTISARVLDVWLSHPEKLTFRFKHHRALLCLVCLELQHALPSIFQLAMENRFPFSSEYTNEFTEADKPNLDKMLPI